MCRKDYRIPAPAEFQIGGHAMDGAAQETVLRDCRLVQPGVPFTGKQGLQYAVGISAESAGAKGIHMQLVTIPPGGRARAHKHATHETAIYALTGESGVWHGERLEQHSVVKPGEFFYIPADVPHLPYNPSMTKTG